MFDFCPMPGKSPGGLLDVVPNERRVMSLPSARRRNAYGRYDEMEPLSRTVETRNKVLAEVQDTLRSLEHRRHPKLVQQFQARILALQGSDGLIIHKVARSWKRHPTK
jgi:hypothetical protein